MPVVDGKGVTATRIVGDEGGRLHRSWRIRIRSVPFNIGEGRHAIEQQIYADAGDTIRTIDLLCSGFNSEHTADHRTH